MNDNPLGQLLKKQGFISSPANFTKKNVSSCSRKSLIKKVLKKFSCETQLLQNFGVSNTLLNTAQMRRFLHVEFMEMTRCQHGRSRTPRELSKSLQQKVALKVMMFWDIWDIYSDQTGEVCVNGSKGHTFEMPSKFSDLTILVCPKSTVDGSEILHKKFVEIASIKYP